jgi:hypothetical protein
LKDRFCEFPDGAVASLFPQNSMGSLLHRRAGIGWSDQKFNDGPHGKVVEVVADKGRFGNVESKLLLELEQRLRFVFDAHKTVLNSQLARPHLSGAPLSATKEGDFDSCLLQQTNPKTVPHIKTFG